MAMKRKNVPGGGASGQGVGKKGKPSPGGGGQKQQGLKGHKQKPKGGFKKKQFQRDVPLPGEAGPHEGANSEEELEVSDEDVAWVTQHTPSLGFLKNLDTKALNRSVKDTQQREAAASQQPGKLEANATAEDADEPDTQHGRMGQSMSKDNDDEEEGLEAYERVPRSEREDAGPKSRGLPTKTPEGDLQYEKAAKGGPTRALGALPRASEVVQVEGITIEDELEVTLKKRDQEAADRAELTARQEAARRKQQEREAAERVVPPALVALRSLEDRHQRVSRARETMAQAASRLLAGPEEAVGELRVLAGLCADEDSQISRLAMVSLLAVFKDIVPGYRIRPPTEKELEVKVSKEVQRLRDYESALLKQYQAYLKHLLAACKGGLQQPRTGANGVKRAAGGSAAAKALAHARVAMKCLATLLTTLPHFNYASDLLQAVVPHMASPDSQMRGLSCSAVRELLASPETHGKLTLEAVQLVADLVRKHKCVCPPEVVQVLSVLRFTEVRPKTDEEEHKVKKTLKKRDKKKEEQRKKEEKKKRERTAIDAEVDRDFKESEAGPNMRALAVQQSQMLEALFEIYFRVLKACTTSPLITRDPLNTTQPTTTTTTTPNAPPTQPPGLHTGHQKAGNKGQSGAQQSGGASGSGAEGIVGAAAPGLGVARERLLAKHPLLYAALEGLGRYAHLLSVDYFNDIMEVFLELLRAPGLPVIDRLRVLLSASDILRGQGEALNIDRRELHSHLYSALLSAPMRAVTDEWAPGTGPQGHGNGGMGKGGAAAGGKGEQAAEDEDERGDAPGTGALAARSACAARCLGAAAGKREGRNDGDGGMGVGGDGRATERVEDPPAVLLAAVLGQMLCEPRVTDMPRLAAFAKRCAAMAAHAPTPEAMVMLGCIMRMIRRYPRLQSLLEWDGEAPVGGKAWLPDCPDPSEGGGLSACLWELPLLTQHYHPHIAQAASSILAAFAPTKAGETAGGPPLTGPLALPGALKDLGAHYAPLGAGSYRPGPPPPDKHKPRGLGPAVLKRLLKQPASEDWGLLMQQHGKGLDGDGAVEEEEVQEAEEAVGCLVRQYRVARRFQVNSELRDQQSRLVAHIQQFQVHLHKQQQQRQVAAAASKPSAGGKQSKLAEHPTLGKTVLQAKSQPTSQAKGTHEVIGRKRSGASVAQTQVAPAGKQARKQ